LTTETTTEDIFCDFCKIKVAPQLYNRHMQIHNVAQRFTSNELMASMVLTLTEIKVKQDTLIQLLVASMRK
jgi:hypothetical protein